MNSKQEIPLRNSNILLM